LFCHANVVGTHCTTHTHTHTQRNLSLSLLFSLYSRSRSSPWPTICTNSICGPPHHDTPTHTHKHHPWFFVYSLIPHVIIRQLIIEYNTYFGRRAWISFAWWYYPACYLISPTHPSTLSRAAAVRIAFLCVTLLPAHAETQSSTPHSFHPFLLCTDYNTTTTTTTASTILFTTSTDLK